ncbi:TetR/AcrR family transcriptional regulator [Rhodococcus sp. IEGM 1401]|uniref:TetR/AcrR family transcriptional regulator n=1 Tax=unclassified Rhodococcus (in: high G+C Gram-positive bacteria) TaxID=192944 RepID=UPI0007BBEA51|nr:MULTISPECIES: TetR/AcrR family transcriptional regulator [unclassified Rhodococcus (in: high G+C Gram-positive bacteria)]KZE98462.1 TetR family transcriptional regulator [Rhodococcus sp. EPR-147]KZF07290.1 TetR family transcriptional regulator [Rhodococcus sp. EPR-279]MCZ4563628.1 TetR/AcrR family transcriptional regulator [Rhodococcus sp. IEGM 1401]MDI9923762.1 TetR/AcrR family transcriptional regulator [Rhodococcus sp. IEGM 1372]MDI9927238.1 TetR/AcrR family transcriptional regulator [Rho
MTQTVDPRARIEERARNKFEAKRTELAEATLHTLAELGYARTSLREIAQNSEYSHGVLHYYFTDKLDLITHAVRQYEAMCVTRYDEVVANAVDATGLYADFEEKYFATLAEDAGIHRLWYDLRNQALFDGSFRNDVLEIEARREDMIWRVVARYCELRGSTPALDNASAYILLDGIFQRALLHHLADNTAEIAAARRQLLAAFALLDCPTPQ